LVIFGPELLTAVHDLDGFSCGKPSLDRWLKTRGLSNQEKGFTAVLVIHEAQRHRLLWPRADGNRAIAPAAVDPDRSAARSGPLPACWDSSRQIRIEAARIGTGLLKHTLQRCVTAAGLIGGRALIVNAVDVEAAAFWRRRGFIPSKEDPLILFRSIADIAASLR
jgi:hypothetical protein